MPEREHSEVSSCFVKTQRALTVSTDPVDHPIGCLEIRGLSGPNHDVLHVPPGQIPVRLEGEGTDAGG